ncbi:MAG TPA: low temperature requirement protein A [Actinophytocola sp.]|jgi:low temperature requirement protein LtrA|uniref:low temperature requirement protein A n=1 Tax=Actinophytocola sp. TaxID=1872138 RepID=UPI002F94322A
MPESPEPGDRHASWLELFFDLVVVAAVHQLTHLLETEGDHGPDRQDMVLFVTLYLAIWLVWTTFTLYSNVLAERVRVRSMFLGMGGIAVMAASVPEVLADRANIFAVAYLVTSALGNGAFSRSGLVVLSWGAATRTAGLLPWIISFWVADPRWKLTLWIVGLAMTLYFSVLFGRGGSRQVVDRLNQQLARRTERSRQRRARAGGDVPGAPKLVVAQVDTAHLGERLGLFVIIVLGEGMLLLVDSWSQIDDWAPGGGKGWLLALAVVSGFALLITLWALNVRYAFAEAHPYSPSVVLPAHFLVVVTITTIAAGLGAVEGAPAEHLPASTNWLLCSGVSAFLLIVTLLSRATRRWALTAVAIALPIGAGALEPVVPASVIALVLTVAAAGQLWNLGKALASDA